MGQECGNCEPQSPVGHSEESGQQGKEEVQAGRQPSLQVVKSEEKGFRNVLVKPCRLGCWSPGLYWQENRLSVLVCIYFSY